MREIPPREQKVIECFKEFEDSYNDIPSIVQISENTKLSTFQVYKIIQKLEKTGILEDRTRKPYSFRRYKLRN